VKLKKRIHHANQRIQSAGFNRPLKSRFRHCFFKGGLKSTAVDTIVISVQLKRFPLPLSPYPKNVLQKPVQSFIPEFFVIVNQVFGLEKFDFGG